MLKFSRHFIHVRIVKFFGVNVFNFHFCLCVDACVAQCFNQGFIRLGQIHILAHHTDGDMVLWVF